MSERRLNIPIIVTDKGSASLKDIERNFAGVQKQMVATTASSASLGAGLGSLKATFAGLAASLGLGVIASLGKGVLETADRFERMKDSLDVITKGEGDKWFQELNDWALKMPVNTEKAIDSFKMLRAMGINPTTKDMTTLVDTVLGLGLAEDGMSRIARALGQIQSKGRLMAQEMLQLQEANIPVKDILQEELGLTSGQLADVGKMRLDSQKVIDAILRGLEKRYGGLALKLQDSFGGLTETIVSFGKEFARQLGVEGGVLEHTEGILLRYATAMEDAFKTGTAQKWIDVLGPAMIGVIDLADATATSILGIANRIMEVMEASKTLWQTVQGMGYTKDIAAGATEMEAREGGLSLPTEEIEKFGGEILKWNPVQQYFDTIDTGFTGLATGIDVAWKALSRWKAEWDDWEIVPMEIYLQTSPYSPFESVTEEQKQTELDRLGQRKRTRESRDEWAREYAHALPPEPSAYEAATTKGETYPKEPFRPDLALANARQAVEEERKKIEGELEKLRGKMNELTGKTVTEQIAYWSKYENEWSALIKKHHMSEKDTQDLSLYVGTKKSKAIESAIKEQKVSYEKYISFRTDISESLMELTQGETQVELNEITKRKIEREKDLKEWVSKAREESENFKEIIKAAYGSEVAGDLSLFSTSIEDVDRIKKEMESASEERKAVLSEELKVAETVYAEIKNKYVESEDKKIRAAFTGFEERKRIAMEEGAVLADIFQATIAETDKLQKGVSKSFQERLADSVRETSAITMTQYDYQRWAEEDSFNKKMESLEKEKAIERDMMNESIRFIEEETAKGKEASKEEITQRQMVLNSSIENLKTLETTESAYAAERKVKINEITKAEEESNLLKRKSTEEYLTWHLEKLAEQGASIRELEEAELNWRIENNENFFKGMILGFDKIRWEWEDFGRRGAQASQQIAGTLSSSMSGAFMDVIEGTKGVDEAFAQMGEAVIRTILDIIAQLMVEYLILMAIKGITAIAGLGTSAATGAVGGATGAGGMSLRAHSGGIIGDPSIPKYMHSGGMASPTPRIFSAMRRPSTAKGALPQDEVLTVLQKGEAVIDRDTTRQERDIIDYLLNPWKKLRSAEEDISSLRIMRGQAQYGFGNMIRDTFEKGRAADDLVNSVSSPLLKDDYRAEDAMFGATGFDITAGQRHMAADGESKVGKISRLLRPEVGGGIGGVGNAPLASLGAVMAAQQSPPGGDRSATNDGGGGVAPVTVNLINHTNTQFTARAGETRRDGKKQIQDVFLESLFTNAEFKQNARKGLGMR